MSNIAEFVIPKEVESKRMIKANNDDIITSLYKSGKIFKNPIPKRHCTLYSIPKECFVAGKAYLVQD